jgi:hypothetical protein
VSANSATFVLRIGAVEADAEERADLVQGLHRELNDLDIDELQLVSGGPAPQGAKGDPATIALAVSVAAAGADALVRTLFDWVRSRRQRCVVQIDGPNGSRIEIPGVPMEEVSALLVRWSTEPGTDPAAEAL